ncbi:PHOsphatase [Kappamyces sp. JEL0829]|nr:PHOsphatase [Kappamyces sp. JEL0829]
MRFLLCCAPILGRVVQWPVEGNGFEVNRSLATASPYAQANYNVLASRTLVQVHLFARHGARYPTEGNAKDQLELASLLQQTASFPQLDLHFALPDAGLLSPSGAAAAEALGERMAERYADSQLFSSLAGLQSSASNSDRVVKTAQRFFKGLLGQQSTMLDLGVVANRTLDADNDPTYACRRYVVQKLPKTNAQVEAYEAQFLPALAQRLSAAIGTTLTPAQASVYLDMCAYQIGNGFSADREGVCGLLQPQDFQDYEIREDLGKYYSLSYGTALNDMLACSALTGFAKDVASQKLKGRFRFSHAETITPLVTALGLFRDDHDLLGNQTRLALSDRKFILSSFTPFLGHFVLEVYARPGTSDRFDVRLVLNEVPMVLAPCKPSLGAELTPEDYLCPFEDFVRVYAKYIGCDYDALCGNTAVTVGGSNQ